MVLIKINLKYSNLLVKKVNKHTHIIIAGY